MLFDTALSQLQKGTQPVQDHCGLIVGLAEKRPDLVMTFSKRNS